jgi:predicted 3-demethylubiquinone-9 3-methyltransferase (glyoxalase superfamily)
MASKRGAKIFPHFWFVKEAEEAARFYAGIFPESRVNRVFALPSDTPSGPAGTVKIVDFTLFGQRFQAMSAGPLDPFNHAISMVVTCDDQAEIDRYWAALLQGGVEEQCGWLKDRYGVSWQIVPSMLDDLISDTDAKRARRVTDALLEMVKLDIAKLRAAYDGRG